jgi:hypothetical protein
MKRFTLVFTSFVLSLTSVLMPFPVSLNAQTSGGAGYCTGCTTSVVIINQVPCTIITCRDPNFPNCLSQAPSACTPGSTIDTAICFGNNEVIHTVYVCNAEGRYAIQTQNILAGFFVTRDFCDFGANNAGCGRADNGDLLGIPRRVTQSCGPNGTSIEDTAGACGDPPCRIPARCVISGEIHCPQSECAEQSPPICYDAGGKWVCSFDGVPIVELTKPCPAVSHQPFPRSMVGIPNSFAIISGCNGGSASNKVNFEERSRCGKKVVAYSASVSAACAAPDMGSAWTMDERAWNLGHVSDGGAAIQGSRNGVTMQHIFETSSYDKPANGPGFPNMAERQPAYQITLRTQWLLSANFSEDLKVTKTKCYIQGTNTEVACDRTDVIIEERTVEEIETHNIGSYVFGPFDVFGARVPQDTYQPSFCGDVPLVVIQSQAVIDK